ncbi:MAG: dephospho-CoA kinase [Parasporobacterium sp.]|nr:dephospho-CoA kinase [Parasporobacterium sp.]
MSKGTIMVIGVTGGVGTGKSTILQILKEKYNAVIIIADDIARDLMMPHEASYEAAVRYFGEDILTEGPGSPIDRAHLAQIVFHDPEKLEALNNMTHPLVKTKIRSLIDAYQSEGRGLIVLETAILIRAGYLDIVDELWVICADYETRVQRLMASRGYTREKTDSIIRSQMSDEEMTQYAALVIDNSRSIDFTEEQIRQHMLQIL